MSSLCFSGKAWKRMVTKVTFVGEGFTRKPPKYERFIRPMVSVNINKYDQPIAKTKKYIDDEIGVVKLSLPTTFFTQNQAFLIFLYIQTLSWLFIRAGLDWQDIERSRKSHDRYSPSSDIERRTRYTPP